MQPVINLGGNVITKRSATACTLDLRYKGKENSTGKNLNRGEVVTFPTGITIKDMDDGLSIMLFSRREKALEGITVMGAPYVYTSEFRGEIIVPLMMITGTSMMIKHGELIAEMMIQNIKANYTIEDGIRVEIDEAGGYAGLIPQRTKV